LHSHGSSSPQRPPHEARVALQMEDREDRDLSVRHCEKHSVGEASQMNAPYFVVISRKSTWIVSDGFNCIVEFTEKSKS